MKRLHIILSALAFLTATSAPARQESTPELPGALPSADTTASYMRPVETELPPPQAVTPSILPQKADPRLSHFENTLSAPSVLDIPLRLGAHGPATALPAAVTFPLWRGGFIGVTGGSTSLPGLMGIEHGSLTFGHQFGSLTVSAYASAAHYGYFRGMQTAFGFGGSLHYRFDDRWSLTVFGAYSTPLHPLTPAMASYMSATNFGGYASYEIDEHWGINVGARATRSLVTNRWEAQPIVEPYCKINGKTAIGVDVGGILYNILKSNSEKKGGYRPNPTIGPPVGGPPPVAPRPDR